jgi:hypothetical protein
MHAAPDSTLYLEDIRSAARPDRYPHRRARGKGDRAVVAGGNGGLSRNPGASQPGEEDSAANFCGGTCLLQRADDAASDPQILPPRPRPAEPAGPRDQKVWPVSESLRQNTEGQPDDRGFRRRYQD